MKLNIKNKKVTRSGLVFILFCHKMRDNVNFHKKFMEHIGLVPSTWYRTYLFCEEDKHFVLFFFNSKITHFRVLQVYH